MACFSITKKFGLPLCLALTGCSSLLYHPTHHQYFDPLKLGLKPDVVTFASEDGVRLSGWYFQNRDHKLPKALVVFFHGNAENMTSHYTTLVFLLAHEIDFFIFDYRGYGLSEGHPTPRGTVDDGIAALRWARFHITDVLRKEVPIVVFGQSLGGAIALKSVIEAKDRIPIGEVIVDSTFSSY